jgi:hypothetical protein
LGPDTEPPERFSYPAVGLDGDHPRCLVNLVGEEVIPVAGLLRTFDGTPARRPVPRSGPCAPVPKPVQNAESRAVHSYAADRAHRCTTDESAGSPHRPHRHQVPDRCRWVPVSRTKPWSCRTRWVRPGNHFASHPVHP